MRSWKDLRIKLDLDDNRLFCWIKIIHTIPSALEEMFF